jgi:hypothetical protein
MPTHACRCKTSAQSSPFEWFSEISDSARSVSCPPRAAPASIVISAHAVSRTSETVRAFGTRKRQARPTRTAGDSTGTVRRTKRPAFLKPPGQRQSSTRFKGRTISEEIGAFPPMNGRAVYNPTTLNLGADGLELRALLDVGVSVVLGLSVAISGVATAKVIGG